jgi:hypothetical protein
VLVGDDKNSRSFRTLDLAGNLVDEIILQGLRGAELSNVAWAATGFRPGLGQGQRLEERVLLRTSGRSPFAR